MTAATRRIDARYRRHPWTCDIHLTLAIVTIMLCSAILALQSYAFVFPMLQCGMILQCLLPSGGWVCKFNTTLY